MSGSRMSTEIQFMHLSSSLNPGDSVHVIVTADREPGEEFRVDFHLDGRTPDDQGFTPDTDWEANFVIDAAQAEDLRDWLTFALSRKSP